MSGKTTYKRRLDSIRFLIPVLPILQSSKISPDISLTNKSCYKQNALSIYQSITQFFYIVVVGFQ